MNPKPAHMAASLVLLACAFQGDLQAQVPLPGGATLAESLDPVQLLGSLEQDLVGAEDRTLAFSVRAEGAFSAELEGELVLLPGRGLELEASGTFGGGPVSVWLRSEGGRMVWGNEDRSFQDDLPHGLRDGVVIGLTRMGVLHNLARLVSGAPPDRVDGTARSWVEMEDIEWSEDRSDEGLEGVRVRIVVSDEPAGRATLWFDEDGALMGRDQVVEFPGGEMRVTERYRWSR